MNKPILTGEHWTPSPDCPLCHVRATVGGPDAIGSLVALATIYAIGRSGAPLVDLCKTCAAAIGAAESSERQIARGYAACDACGASFPNDGTSIMCPKHRPGAAS